MQFAVHVDIDSMGVLPYRPASHRPLHIGVGSPGILPYKPEVQLTHTHAPVKLYFPNGHISVVEFEDPAAQMYPAVQFAVHREVTWPAVPYRPASHNPLHVDKERPDTEPYKPAAQGAVQPTVFNPIAAPYSPALQFVHNPAPVQLYLPNGHIDAVELVDPAAQL